MKRLILIIAGAVLSSQVFSVQLENVNKGEFDITSTAVSSSMISIDATGKVGKYGRVYVSYNLHTDRNVLKILISDLSAFKRIKSHTCFISTF